MCIRDSYTIGRPAMFSAEEDKTLCETLQTLAECGFGLDYSGIKMLAKRFDKYLNLKRRHGIKMGNMTYQEIIRCTDSK